jgi:phospholipase/carboxylesterase
MPIFGNQDVHKKEVIARGPEPAAAGKAIILLHGRGASARDILTLGNYLDLEGYTLWAPEATNHTWYPYSFLALPEQNEPWLTSALDLIAELVGDLNAAGLESNQIYFAGFSQGACLTLEFVARNARHWGGIAAFTGGLIGDRIYQERYKGHFASTPIYIGTSDPDPHVPVSRVYETAHLLRKMGADVTQEIFPGLGHTISDKEIERANTLIFRT